MNTLLRVINIFFVTLGVIFFILILICGYIWFADPFHVFSMGASPFSFMKIITGNTAPAKVDNVDKNPLLNEQQEAQLEGLGIDPSALPTKITPAMEACFTAKLGQERTAQIVKGSAPTPLDFFKARTCLELR